MDQDEYQSTQFMLQNLAMAVRDLDLNGFLNNIGRANAIGPIIDPTLYRAAMGNLEKIERLARAARVFQKEVQALAAEGVKVNA